MILLTPVVAALVLAALLPAGAAAAPVDQTASAARTYSLAAAADGSLRYTRTSITARAGSVTLRMRNPSSNFHNVALGNRRGRIVGRGGVSTVTARLKAGRYTYFCSVPGHRAAGMRGTLTVR
jgi:uncharacterized cupredoxin-like copper-binding protein